MNRTVNGLIENIEFFYDNSSRKVKQDFSISFDKEYVNTFLSRASYMIHAVVSVECNKNDFLTDKIIIILLSFYLKKKKRKTRETSNITIYLEK